MLKKNLLLIKKNLMENKGIKLESINNNSNNELEKNDIKLE
jgi:hypothetical protein